MYLCRNCKRFFEEPKEVETSYESYYGVSGDFPFSTPLILSVCPFCLYEDIEEYEDDEEEEYEEDDE